MRPRPTHCVTHVTLIWLAVGVLCRLAVAPQFIGFANQMMGIVRESRERSFVMVFLVMRARC
jgi:hypothetical protein